MGSSGMGVFNSSPSGAGVDWANVGGMAAGAVAPYLAPNNNLNPEQRARQDAIARQNDYSAQIARDQAFDPTRSFREMRAGQNLASSLAEGGRSGVHGYGAGLGGEVAGTSDPTQLAIIAALRDPSTFSMRKEGDQFVFDPAAFNPLELAVPTGNARDGGYMVDGEKLRFGREGSEGDGSGDAYRGAASGALSGAGTGASVGTAVAGPAGTAIGAGVGAAAGGIYGYFQGRSMEREANVNRDQNLATMNDYAAEIAARKSFSPIDAYRQMIGGLNTADSYSEGGYATTGYGIPANELVGPNMSADNQALIAALRDPTTYSMGRGKNGELIFDPEQFNPLDLAFMEGKAKKFGYSRAGDEETSYFGR